VWELFGCVEALGMAPEVEERAPEADAGSGAEAEAVSELVFPSSDGLTKTFSAGRGPLWPTGDCFSSILCSAALALGIEAPVVSTLELVLDGANLGVL
jgi:hypothetical protein